MKYANTIQEVLTFMTTEPLKKEELDEFYVETMPVRTGDPDDSPIWNIMDACEIPSDRNSFLFLGHKGCGKSTELNKMAGELETIGHKVITIQCDSEVDRSNLSYEDVLILMGDSLLRLAEAQNLTLAPDLIRQIERFWRGETIEEKTRIKEAQADFEAGTGLSALLHFFSLSVKGSLKYGDTIKTTYREKIEKKSSEWIQLLRNIIDQITVLCEGCQPILIFEDLDKMEPETAWRVFYDHCTILSRMSCPVIYTFPITLSYDPKFSVLHGYFQTEILPMIKIATPEGERFEEGYREIREIISRRMDAESLFEGGLSRNKDTVLNYLIEKTGGVLRDLFYVILDCARMAKWDDLNCINRELADLALEEMKSYLTRRIERKHYAFLADIWKGNNKSIEDKVMLLEMLQTGIVFEYGIPAFYNLHPLVSDFLAEQDLLFRKRA